MQKATLPIERRLIQDNFESARFFRSFEYSLTSLLHRPLRLLAVIKDQLLVLIDVSFGWSIISSREIPRDRTHHVAEAFRR